ASWGIAVTNGAAWTTPSFSKSSPVQAEYQLCFKCHSSWAYGGSPPIAPSGGFAQTDQSKEFNVNNASYHWVEGDQSADSGVTPRTYDGRNMTLKAGSGWTATSRMACTDCHASETGTDLRGSHGSTQPFLLSGRWTAGAGGDGTGKANTSNDLCFQCHDWNIYGQEGSNRAATASGFSDGSENLHVRHLGFSSVTSCQSCHSAIPHGNQKRALLVETTDPAPYNQGGSYGSKLQVLRWAASGNWQESDCGTCH
ncbi:MAG: hypothetical protein EPO21_05940, partial [Chloroflexota bacterium]